MAKVGNRIQKKLSLVKIGEVDDSSFTLGKSISKIQQGIAGRIVTELFFKVRHSAQVTHSSGSPSFRANNGVLQQMVSKIRIKLDTQDYIVDASPKTLKYLDYRSKKSLQHCGCSTGAAALADNVEVTVDNNQLVLPSTTEYLTADEYFSINFADAQVDFQQSVRTALDTRNATNLFIEFESQPASEYFAVAGNAVVANAKLKIEVYARVIDDLLPTDVVQLMKCRITEQEKYIRSSGEKVTFDLSRDGSMRGLHMITQNGSTGLPFSNLVVDKVLHRKNKEKDVIDDSTFLLMKAIDEENFSLYDPYSSNIKQTLGIMGKGYVMDSLDEAVQNNVQSDGKTPTVNYELEVTGSSAATYTNPCKVVVVEEVLLAYAPLIRTA